MKTKTTKRKAMETVAGAAIGAVIAGPVGAVVGGLAAGHVESGLDYLAKLKPPPDRNRPVVDDPIIHVHPRRILVPLDFSPPSTRAMRFAREWAKLFGSEVYLLHVVEPIGTSARFQKSSVGAIPRDIVSQARVCLEELARTEFSQPIRTRIAVRNGKAFDQIAAAARDFRIDVIVIATHGRTGLKHMLLGSTTERVVRHAPCPVLVLRRRPNR